MRPQSPLPHDPPHPGRAHADSALRLARSVAFSAVCMILAVLAHQVAGGAGPSAWDMTLGGSGVLGVSFALAGRERSAAPIAGLLLAAQAALHELFTHGATMRAVLAGPPGQPATGGMHGLTDHVLHGGGLSAGLGMLIAHLTATLITAWWLALGEAALWSLLRRAGAAAVRHLRSLLGHPVRRDLARRAAPGRVVWQVPHPPSRQALRHTLSRRGPPLPA